MVLIYKIIVIASVPLALMNIGLKTQIHQVHRIQRSQHTLMEVSGGQYPFLLRATSQITR